MQKIPQNPPLMCKIPLKTLSIKVHCHLPEDKIGRAALWEVFLAFLQVFPSLLQLFSSFLAGGRALNVSQHVLGSQVLDFVSVCQPALKLVEIDLNLSTMPAHLINL